MALTAVEVAERANNGTIYDRLYMRLPERIDTGDTYIAALSATKYAQDLAPKSSGASARNLTPVYGEDYFGIRWIDSYVWYQEMGIAPFVMRSLAGKTIPMWVEDRDGELRRKNPRINRRVTVDGREQVLIFRKAAQPKERKIVKRRRGGLDQWVSVPKSYPGAPGRINRRAAGAPLTSIGGQIMKGNVGVRWRHPGLAGRFFIHTAILLAGRELGFPVGPIHVAVRSEAV